MAFRVSGYILNPYKEIFIALTSIFGIGKKYSLDICKQLSINPKERVKDLDKDIAFKITEYITNNYTTGDDLKKQIMNNKKKYISINCYRGKRLRLGLPCHGQRTRSNASSSRMLGKKLL